jgi:hypothetical protein
MVTPVFAFNAKLKIIKFHIESTPYSIMNLLNEN